MSSSMPHCFFRVGQTPPLYDNQCMVLFPNLVSTHPLEWNWTSGKVTLQRKRTHRREKPH